MSTFMYSLLAGASTAIGVIILEIFGEPSHRVLASLLGFAGGIMLAISVFELLPEALLLGSMTVVIVGFLLGALMMYGLDRFIPHSHMSASDEPNIENPDKIHVRNPMLRIGFLILFGIAIHNLPEGLAIGAGFESSPEAGIYIAMAIGLHNIPEGLAIAGPLKTGGMGFVKLFLFTLAAGLMTPLGTLIGQLFFNVSPVFVGGSLAFAAGAMVYIVNDELVPQSNDMHDHFANAGILGGILLGFIIL